MSDSALKVLIIEDEAVLRNGLADKFTREGITAVGAENGEVGLVKALELHPDFIILDMLMPKMGGAEFLEHLKTDSWGKDAKVFIWSNSKNPEKMNDATKFGILDFWVKSDMTFGDIVGKIKALV